MKKLYFAWIIALAAVIYITKFYSTVDTVFYGISDSKEIEINQDKPVIIDSIFVLAGESVKSGQLLMTLRSKDIENAISEKKNKLEELSVKKSVGKTDIKSQIAQLKQEMYIKSSEIDQKIETLTAQYNRNRAFASTLKSITVTTGAKETKSELLNEIENLKEDKRMAISSFNLRINQLVNADKNGEDPTTILIENIKSDLAELESQKNSLKIVSNIDGIIGAINYKAQSTVAPYSTIISLSKKSPSFIKGYIHENVYNRVSVGDIASITSVASRESISGKVVGVGSRIVEFPDRLRKLKDLKVWGREIFIQIPEDNQFLLGEKVTISVE